MVTHKRSLTAAILLASYLLANAIAWVHLAHQRGSLGQADGPAPVSAGCCAHHHGGERTVPEQLKGAAPHDAPCHQQDDCTFCRFQLTKKLAELVPVTLSSSIVFPELTALDVPLYRVAPLLATPHSRAPPSLA